MIKFILILVALGLVIDIVVFFGLKRIIEYSGLQSYQKLIYGIFFTMTAVTIILTIYTYIQSKDPGKLVMENKHYYLSGYFIATYLPKITFVLGFLLFFIVKLISGIWDVDKLVIYKTVLLPFAFLALLNLLFFTHGILWGKFKYTIKDIPIISDRLPEAFNGFKIVQISDFHIGSFRDYPQQVERAVRIINDLEPDMIVFTGDLVNILAEEAQPHVEALKKLVAPYGKFAILGNHDYGAYYQWESEDQQRKNHQLLQDIIVEMGFELMLNESRIIKKGADSLALLGVENWGRPPFPQHGDLSQALEGVPDDNFKLLLSHDPTHWDMQVIPESDIDLTLSGHTHAMQMGIEIGRFKFSPSKYVYPRWSGLYEEDSQRLYVNRGIGFIGFPGRAGMWPEITLLTLKSS